MYTILLVLLLALSVYLLFRGISHQSTGKVASGIVLGVVTILFFWFMDFWGEVLWFEAIGYSQRFWTMIVSKAAFGIVTAIFGFLIVWLFTFTIPLDRQYLKWFAKVLGFVIGGIWGLSNWDLILKYWYKVPSGISEPILEKDASFYLFTLPFLDILYTLLLLLLLISLIASLFAAFFKVQGDQIQFDISWYDEIIKNKLYQSIYINSALIVFLLAWGKYLNHFHLMYSTWGAVQGPGWTDVNIKLPAYLIVSIITAILGIMLLIPFVRNRLKRVKIGGRAAADRSPLFVLGMEAAAIIIVWFLLLTAIPGLFQWLRVEPNEITFEKSYIKNNIELTRHGFKLNQVEERKYPATEVFNQEIVNQNQQLFNNVRLWDWRALDAVYKQFQEIRLYYEFTDVDIDRYTIDGDYRQVMVSAREMELDNLPEQSQTFVNRRFKYTHGYGITMTPVHEFTPEGLPNLLIKDIPPKSKYSSLKVGQPQIYYGELTRSHVVVNSREKEFDYPSGEQNVYVNYSGKGGVQLSNVWRNFLYGWKFDGTKFFFSEYPKDDSRLMFHREIKNRVRNLAPFLTFDKDPYIVLNNGKLYWILDAYTTSEYFPYSEPFNSTEQIEYKQGNRTNVLTTQVGLEFNGANYIRNSVKVVIDAFNGSVDFYIFDENDPLIRVWDNIFPELFKAENEMPEELKKHVRYPQDMLLIQGLVYAKYHMNDPTVFYNQEDLWIRATEKYYNSVQPVEPYYVMWELPGSDSPDFVLMLPFTPKNRQVLIGWIAGMCDGENYGRFLAYKFPKEKRVLGPQQVETKIDQDRFLSGQLTLWDQRGSNVIRGNVLAIPIENTLFYVEPIYLKAETAAYPELRLVVVMHNDQLSYAETFDKALTGLLEKGEPKVTKEELAPIQVSLEKLIKNANDAFEDYLQFIGEKEFKKASDALERLQQALNQLSEQSALNETETK